MNEKQFKEFVEGNLAEFMERYKLVEISVKDDLGNKAKIKKNASGLLVSDVTTTAVL